MMGFDQSKICGAQHNYINPAGVGDFYTQLLSLDDDVIFAVGKILSIPPMPAKRMLFEYIVPQLSANLKLKKEFDYMDFMIGLLEYSAIQKGIERYRVYDYNEFFARVKCSPAPKKSLLEVVPGSGLLTRKRAATELLIKFLFGNKQRDKQEVIV